MKHAENAGFGALPRWGGAPTVVLNGNHSVGVWRRWPSVR